MSRRIVSQVRSSSHQAWPCLRRTCVRVMVVVPALAGREHRDERVVPAGVRRVVAARAPHMGQRIDRPRGVPHDHRPKHRAPHDKAHAELNGGGEAVIPQSHARRTRRRNTASHDSNATLIQLLRCSSHR